MMLSTRMQELTTVYSRPKGEGYEREEPMAQRGQGWEAYISKKKLVLFLLIPFLPPK